MNKKQISSKYLKGDSIYHYCPFCVHELKKQGINWKDELKKKEEDRYGGLKPMKSVLLAEPIKQPDGTWRDNQEWHYECGKCGNTNITEKTFLIFYARRFDGSKYNERPVEPGTVWSKEKECLVPAFYDDRTGTWHERIDKTQSQ